MADYSIAQLKAALAGAGASGPALDVATAISLAENTGRELRATSPNSDGSIDRGPIQFNSRWHPEVSDACAFDLACSAKEMARVSDNFTNFRPWTTFNTGAYTRHLPAVQGVAVDPSAGPGPLASLTAIPGAGIVTDAAKGVVDAVRKSLLAAVFVAGGLGLVVAGLWRASAPARGRAKAKAEETGQQAGQVAMLAAMA